jgi:transposase InsO family protein
LSCASSHSAGSSHVTPLCWARWQYVPDVRLLEEFAFLAIGLDAFSRRVIGWALEIHLQASLALAALQMALAARRPPPGTLIHHSDRGVQYACADSAARLAEHGIQPSMSRVGSPYDTAKAESFMKPLKLEEVEGRAYRDAADARRSVGSFIEEVYNRQRLHSALAYLTPTEFDATLRPEAIAATAACGSISNRAWLTATSWSRRSESGHEPLV